MAAMGGPKKDRDGERGGGIPSVLVLTDERPDLDALNWKVHKVHTDMDFVRSSMGSEMTRICHGLQDARVAVETHESQLAQLWRASRSAEAELRELNRLVEKVGSKLHSMLSEARAETAQLQETISKGLDDGRLVLEGRVQEIRTLVCAGDLEQGKATQQALQETQAWQARAELRIAAIDDGLLRARAEAAMSSEAVRDELHRACEQIQERDRLAEVNQRNMNDSLHTEAKALSEKQSRCASELHRLVRGLADKVDSGQQQQLALERVLAGTRAEMTGQREGATEELQAGLLRTAEEARDGREALQRHLEDQLGGLEARLSSAKEECRAWPGTLASAEGRLANEDTLIRQKLKEELEKMALWTSGRLDAEVGKLVAQMAEVNKEVSGMGERLARQEERSAALSASLADADARLSKEDVAFRERLAELASGLSAAEAKLSSEDAVTREQLTALSSTLTNAQHHLKGEDQLTREQMDSVSAEQARGHRELCKRLESLAAQLASAESRLAGEDNTMRERLEALSTAVKSSDQRLSSDGLDLRKQVEQLTGTLSASENNLCSDTAAMRERLDALTESLAATEGRLSREDSSARERLESLNATLTSLENRFGACDAATRQRVEAVATEQAGAEARFSRDLAANRRQLDALGAQLAGAESRLQSEDSFLRARVEALTTNLDNQESRRGGEEAATRERLESLAAGLAAADGRLSREGAVMRDRLEQLGVGLSGVESRLGTEQAAARKQLEGLTSSLARNENATGSEIAGVRERLEALGSALSGAENRLASEDMAIRDRLEERIKEEISWMLALVKPVQQSIDKLAWGFHDLGCSHVRCAREFEVLEQVVKDVEVRVLPWRSGLDRDTLRFARAVQPGACNSLMDAASAAAASPLPSPVPPRSLTDGTAGSRTPSITASPIPASAFSTPPVRKRLGPRRPASARPGSGLAKRLVVEHEHRCASAQDMEPRAADVRVAHPPPLPF